MTKYLLIPFLGLTTTVTKAQNIYFPPLTGNTWDTISPTTLGWCQDKIDTLLNYLDNRNTKAFILLKDGKIVIEKYYGTFTQDSIWYWASAAKSLTAFTVGIAQQEEFLSIYDTTSAYLGNGWTDCTTAQEEKITIRHQLTMTSGLDDGVPDNTCTIDTCLQYLSDAGTRWAYHTAPYTLLGGVIQSATGQSLNSYLTAKVKNPTGMTGAFLPSGYNNVFYSKPRSMARFGLLILNNGNWNGNQIMTDTSYFNQMVNTSQSINESYGYLWWLNGKNSFMVPALQFVFPGSMNPNAPDDMIAAMGGNGQIINVVPSENLVFIRMGNAPLTSQDVPTTINDTIWQKLNDVMCKTSSVTDYKTDGIKVYPNPASETITIDFFKNTIGQIDLKIFNVFGQLVFTQKIFNNMESTTLDISRLGEGIYFTRMTLDNQIIYDKKIISTR